MGIRLLVNGGRSFRLDLEGIRGICLLIILSAHLIGWPAGGFVALDVFFVLSGYLITGLIVREHQRTGTIDIPAFYRRRIRRLGPAAMLVIAATVATGFLIFPVARAISLTWDGVWSTLLVANWNFAINNTDYFATWLPQSPLLHYWSLSVEEQFYLVWPALILLATSILPRRRSRRRQAARSPYRVLLVAISVIALASLAWSVVQSLSNPAVAYLSTLTRAWELCLGALLFFGNRHWERIAPVWRPILAWTGTAVFVGAAFVLTPADAYPGYLALIPCLATAAIIVAGVGGESHLLIATNPVSRYLGQISYTTYLWHWPVFVFIGAVVGKQSPVYLWGAVPISLVVAALTFHFIEDPIRRSSWLEPRRRRHRRRSERERQRRAILVRVIAGVSLVAAVSFAVAVLVVQAQGSGGAAQTLPRPSAGTPSPDAATDGAAEAAERAVISGLSAAAWPQPVIEQIDRGFGGPDGVLQNKCLDVSDKIQNECVFGDASLPHTAVLLGDSVALSWTPGLVPALNAMGYRVQLLTHSLCPFAQVSVTGSFATGKREAGFPGVCDDHRAWARAQTIALHPDLVIASDGEAEMSTLILPDGQKPQAYWTAGLRTSIEALQGIPVVLLTSPPVAPSVTDCYTRVATVKDCTGRIRPEWRDQRAAIDHVAGAQGVRVVDTRSWFCSPDGWCPPFASDTVIRADEQHLSAAFAQLLRPALQEALSKAVQEDSGGSPSSGAK